MTENTTQTEAVDKTASQSDHLIESLTKEVVALKEEVKQAKEAALATQAVSKGNISRELQETSPYTYLENFRDGDVRGYAENELVLEGKRSGKMAIFATHPEKFY